MFKDGTYVRVARREPSSADLKQGIYYNHFAGICGTVDNVGIDNTTCVVHADLETLPVDVLERHREYCEKHHSGNLIPYSIEVRIEDLEKIDPSQRFDRSEILPLLESWTKKNGIEVMEVSRLKPHAPGKDGVLDLIASYPNLCTSLRVLQETTRPYIHDGCEITIAFLKSDSATEPLACAVYARKPDIVDEIPEVNNTTIIGTIVDELPSMMEETIVESDMIELEW